MSPAMASLRVSTELRNEFSRRLSALLECPSCSEYMLDDIYQCVQGHSLCSACRRKTTACPKCSGPLADTRCLLAEQVAQEIYYPCNNSQAGCAEMLLLKDRKEHELNCLHRVYSCTRGDACAWQGVLRDLVLHVEQAHKFDSTDEVTAKYWSYDVAADSHHELVALVHGEIFVCARVYKAEARKHLFYATHVGAKDRAADFCYDVTVYTPDAANKKVVAVTNMAVPNVSEEQDIYESGQAVMLDDCLVRRLVSGDKLRYKFAIHKL
ncbi:probable E3 ubiquitin-protein ligase sinah [Bacillus rossius redtenbacheri]|uniref:probable E3 ubiquitin-protein ligase sinah n=1 Tax=Bacillus rossius redtenbacheri TaxID=93214 RepID=UPI002FDCB0DC